MKIEILIFLFLSFNFCKGEESFFVLNGKKSLNYVSDKFISFVVDPTVLFTDLNISETAHELGRFLSPSYVRIAGFSTKYLKFSENEEDYQPNHLKDDSVLVYTPGFIDYLNEWFIKTNLSMIFALNDRDLIDEGDNFKKLRPILEVFSEFDSNCSFQLGYDTPNLTFEDYKKQLKLLKNTLDEFPLKKNDWKIISNDLNLWSLTNFDLKKNIDDLNNVVDAIFLESSYPQRILPFKTDFDKILTKPSVSKPSIPIWTTLSKSENPITFSSTLTLAKEIANSAILGYEVVFKPPRLYELISETTNYWFIYLHKKLMGRNVLEIKQNGLEKSEEIYISAHCTKNQNNYSRRGAITICIINNKTSDHLTSLKLPLNVVNLKHIEVQSYILNSDNENSTTAYLNNQTLTMDLLHKNQILTPKIRRARITKSLSLTTPSKSIGFFILPDARFPICINDEDETNLIIEEINEEDLESNLSEKTEIKSRNNDLKSNNNNLKTNNDNLKPNSLVDLYNEMKNELEVDEKFYGEKDLLNKMKIKEDFMDVSSREIEEVILKITKKLKGKRDRREARGIGRFGKTKSRISFRKNNLPNLKNFNKWKKKNKRDINMKLLEEKYDKRESLESKLRKLRLKNLKKLNDLNNLDSFKSHQQRKNNDVEANEENQEFDEENQEEENHNQEKENQSQEKENLEDLNEENKEDLKSKEVDSQENDNNSELNNFQKTLNELLNPKSIDFSKLFNLKSPQNPQSFQSQKKKFSSQEKMISSQEKNVSSEKLTENVQQKQPKNQNDEILKDYFNSDELNNFNDNYPDFYDEFGDEIKIINKKSNDNQNLFNKEFIINENNDENIQETIKNLENYFNKALNQRNINKNDFKNSQNLDFFEDFLNNDYLDYSQEINQFRKKREEKEFTEDDILHYKQLMNSNIRHMKENIRKNKLKNNLKSNFKLKAFNNDKKDQNFSDRINKLKQAVEMVQRSNIKDDFFETTTKGIIKNLKDVKKLKPFEKIKLNNPQNNLNDFKNLNNLSKLNQGKLNLPLNNIKLNNVKLLKSRLAQHNKNDEQEIIKKKDEVDDETKQLITMIKNELRNKKPRDVKNLDFFKKEYVPNIKLKQNLRRNYYPIFKNDFLKTRNKRYISNNNDKYNKKYLKNNKLDDSLKNEIDNSITSINSIESNESNFIKSNSISDSIKSKSINSNLNEIIKDGKYFVPKISKNSDFTLVLPSKDEISLKNSEDASELKLKLQSKKIENGLGEITIGNNASDFKNGLKTDNLNNTLSKKGVFGRDSLVNFKTFDKMFDKIFDFIDNVREKMRGFLKYID